MGREGGPSLLGVGDGKNSHCASSSGLPKKNKTQNPGKVVTEAGGTRLQQFQQTRENPF